MRPIVMAASFMLVLAVAVAVPSLALAAPPITQTEAIETAQQLAASVGGYSARHPGDPGAFAAWAGERVEAGAPLLIHSYPALEPSYYYVPLTSQLDVPAHAGHVTLAIYNVHGRLVRTLVDDALPAGPREFVWDGMGDDGRPVSAGAYFARCESNAGSDTRKLVLMR